VRGVWKSARAVIYSWFYNLRKYNTTLGIFCLSMSTYMKFVRSVRFFAIPFSISILLQAKSTFLRIELSDGIIKSILLSLQTR
jgi:hypothetical protein